MESEKPNEPNSTANDALANTSQELTWFDDQEDARVDDIDTPELRQGRLESFSYREGPIPDPLTLREYDAVVPGFAKEFLGSFLKESEHRREMESRSLRLEEETLRVQEKIITANQKRSDRGLLAGFVISMAFLIVGGTLVAKGHDTAGAAIAGVTLPSLAAVFVIGVLRKPQEDKGEDSSALSTEQTEENPGNKE